MIKHCVDNVFNYCNLVAEKNPFTGSVMKIRFGQFPIGLRAANNSPTILSTIIPALIGTLIGITALTQSNDISGCGYDDGYHDETYMHNNANEVCTDTTNNLSWAVWLTGRSRSSQFHFIDLLELLHGHKDRSTHSATLKYSPSNA